MQSFLYWSPPHICPFLWYICAETWTENQDFWSSSQLHHFLCPDFFPGFEIFISIIGIIISLVAKKKKILEHMAHTCWVNLNRLGHAPGSRAVCDVCVDPRRLCLRGLFLYKKTSIRYILWLHWFNDKYINILSWTIFLDLRVYFSSEVKGMKRFSWALKVS